MTETIITLMITYVMYSWHNVPGLQKFGKCTGSIATARPDFVDLGFKPALVIIKRYRQYR